MISKIIFGEDALKICGSMGLSDQAAPSAPQNLRVVIEKGFGAISVTAMTGSLERVISRHSSGSYSLRDINHATGLELIQEMTSAGEYFEAQRFMAIMPPDGKSPLVRGASENAQLFAEVFSIMARPVFGIANELLASKALLSSAFHTKMILSGEDALGVLNLLGVGTNAQATAPLVIAEISQFMTRLRVRTADALTELTCRADSNTLIQTTELGSRTASVSHAIGDAYYSMYAGVDEDNRPMYPIRIDELDKPQMDEGVASLSVINRKAYELANKFLENTLT